MIRKLIAAASLMMLAGFALPVQAADLKIATVRSAELADKAPQFKSMQDKLKAEFERKQNDLEAEAKKLQDDGASFQREADTLTNDARDKKAKDLTTRRMDLESKARKMQEDFGKRRQELFSQTMTSLKAVIDAIAKERNLDVILENPVFAKPDLDITDDVLKRLSAPAAK